MPDADESTTPEKHIMIYMKNEQGVAIPIYVKTSDKVEAIYTEAATTRLIHRGSLKGKAFYHKDQRLKSTDVIGDVGIKHHDSVRLKVLEPYRQSSMHAEDILALMNEKDPGEA
ncbi:hypothetical protein Aduo_014996 [Ancylostoma duodenale]